MIVSDEREDFSYLKPSPRVAEALARLIVAANERLGEKTDPRVLELANLPKAS